MRILTRVISTGLLAGAATVAFATLPAVALAEGGPPTKNLLAPAASDPPDKHALAADWPSGTSSAGDEGEPPGTLVGDEGDPPGSLVGDEGEPPDTLTAKLPSRPKAGEVTFAAQPATEVEPVEARKGGATIVYGIGQPIPAATPSDFYHGG